MTKTLQEIQEFNRRKIICAVNGIEDYEEALNKELIFGCIVIDFKHQFFGKKNPHKMTLVYDTENGEYYFDHYRGNPYLFYRKDEILNKERFQIIGKPLTLDRVLIAIRQDNYYDDIWFGEDNDCSLHFDIKNLSWDLTKPTLEEQSEKTQRAIYELLGGENE
jgi:hypothetical protein